MKKIFPLFQSNFFLIVIIIFSLVIRLWQLDINPAGFFADEALTGYEAYNILHTARDSHGELLPLFFKGFYYDNLSPFQIYMAVPFVALFGLNELAPRSASVFYSTLILIGFYLLLKKLIPKPFALIGTALLAISPWYFHISRLGMGDYYFWLLATLLGLLFFLESLKKEALRYPLLAAIFWALATYSYVPSRLITPLFLVFITIFLFWQKQFKTAKIITITYLFVLIPFILFHVTDTHSFQRIKDTMGIDLRAQSASKQLDSGFTNRFTNKYLLHFSDDFLFTKGDIDFPGQFIRRHSIAGLGLLYPYQKWLLLAGLIWGVWSVKQKRYELIPIFLLFFLFPVADSLTADSTPFATRSYLGIIPLYIFIATGIWGVYQIVNLRIKQIKFILLPSVLLVILYSTLILLQSSKNNPLTTSDFWGWQYGPREIMQYFLLNKDNYDDLYMIGEFNSPEIFLKFYDPKGTCLNKCQIGNFQYYNPEKKQLFAISPDYLAKSALKNRFQILKTIYYPNQKIAFIIGIINPR